MTMWQRTILAGVAAGLAVPATAQLRPVRRFDISAGYVARAVALRAAQDGLSVSLLARVVAAAPEPVLEVVSIEPLSGSSEQSLARVICHVAGECLPFYAVVNWPEGTTPMKLTASQKVDARASSPVVIRAGASAVLLIDGDQAQLRMDVVSLESGAAGKNIRVASRDRKHIYVAEVVSATLLKGSF